MPPKTASPGLGGEISALLALPNAMTNDASLAATHSATSFGSLLLHPQCAVPQAEIHLKRLAMVFLLKLGCSAEINLDFSNIMAVLVCVGFGAFRQLQVGCNNPQHQMRNSGGIITKYKRPRAVLMKRYIKKEIASFFIMLGSPMISPVAFTFAQYRPTATAWRILPSNNPHFWHFPTAISTRGAIKLSEVFEIFSV